jgi:RNA polymerase sigma factor for flagellar operon FliA
LKEILADQSATPPSEAFDTAEMRRALCSCISKLPPAEATVIVLHYLRNIPFQEIAQMMKLTPSRISQVHHHALGSLKKLLQKKESGEF